MEDLEKRFEGYEFEIDIPDKEHFDPSVEAVEVVLSIKNGKRYSMNFASKMYIPYIFDKNKRTRECANGTYFCMPNMIIVKRIDENSIKVTLDDLIKNLEIESYLTEIV